MTIIISLIAFIITITIIRPGQAAPREARRGRLGPNIIIIMIIIITTTSIIIIITTTTIIIIIIIIISIIIIIIISSSSSSSSIISRSRRERLGPVQQAEALVLQDHFLFARNLANRGTRKDSAGSYALLIVQDHLLLLVCYALFVVFVLYFLYFVIL